MELRCDCRASLSLKESSDNVADISGDTISTWATPPKKSVMRVLSKGLLKRSLRTPGVEFSLLGSKESNYGTQQISD